MSEIKKTCGNCRHFDLFEPDPCLSWCNAPVPLCAINPDGDSCAPGYDATNCPCYQPTPLVASIGRNEAEEDDGA